MKQTSETLARGGGCYVGFLLVGSWADSFECVVIDSMHVKEPDRARVRCFVGQISRTLFLTRDSPASLPDGSGC
jgi:hypothetical protein